MISIKSALTDLDLLQRWQTGAVSAYRTALRAIRQYAVEVDPRFLDEHHRNMEVILARLAGTPELESVADTSAAVRCELRRYRDVCGEYLKRLRQEFEENARALEGVMAAMAASDVEGETRLIRELGKLEKLADSVEVPWIKEGIAAAAGKLRRCVEEIKKEHQGQVLQLTAEIQTLHQQITQLESGTAATEDSVRIHGRTETESKIEGYVTEGWPFSVIALRLRNLPSIKAQYGEQLAADLALAFSKRLKNRLGPAVLAGKWTDQQFLVVLPSNRAEAITKAKELVAGLAGEYVFPAPGTVLKLHLQVESVVTECAAGEGMDRVMKKLETVWLPVR